MDVCVVTYRNDAARIRAALRSSDALHVRNNTVDNIGFAAGANAAARMGNQPIVVFMNPDGDPGPGCLGALERALADPGVVAVEASQGPDWDRPASQDGDVEWLSAACMAVRREAFEACGGFDERLFMYGEDVDLSYRLSHFGKLRRAPGAIFQHDAGPRSLKALHRNFRNWLVVQRRHRRADPLRMLRDAAYDVRRARFRHAVARVSGVIDYAVRARTWA